MAFFCKYIGIRARNNKIAHIYSDGRFTSFSEARNWIYDLHKRGDITDIVVDNDKIVAGEDKWGEMIQFITLPDEVYWYEDSHRVIGTTRTTSIVFETISRIVTTPWAFIEFKQNIFQGFYGDRFFRNPSCIPCEFKEDAESIAKWRGWDDDYGRIYLDEIPIVFR